jgi:antirestriction protein ArdC
LPSSLGGNRACFIPKLDEVHMPERASFIGSKTSSATEAYYSSLLHEQTRLTAPDVAGLVEGKLVLGTVPDIGEARGTAPYDMLQA